MVRLSELLAIENLPALPAALARALPLLVDPESDQRELLQIIRQDEALAAAVLKMGNSARYGVPGRHFDIAEAASRIGRERMRTLVLAQQAGDLLEAENQAFDLRRGDLWRSALAGAFAAEDLARTHAPDEAGLAFVGALLRDIGKLALDMAFGGRYAEITRTSSDGGVSFSEAERAALGFDHAQLGAELARQWGLPERLARVIETHHAPAAPGPGHDVVADIVHAADMISLWAGLGVGVDGVAYRLADHVREALGLDRITAEHDIAAVWEKLNQAEKAFGLADSRGAAV